MGLGKLKMWFRHDRRKTQIMGDAVLPLTAMWCGAVRSVSSFRHQSPARDRFRVGKRSADRVQSVRFAHHQQTAFMVSMILLKTRAVALLVGPGIQVAIEYQHRTHSVQTFFHPFTRCIRKLVHFASEIASCSGSRILSLHIEKCHLLVAVDHVVCHFGLLGSLATTG